MKDNGRRTLDRAYEGLEHEVPDRVSRAIRWLRDPQARWIRIPLGILLILSSALWFLPIVGIEFLPLGLLLIAQDIPILREPVGRFMIWLEHQWIAFKRWWHSR
jgi:hypothetical protein